MPFLVVPGRFWNEHDQKSNLERNDPEQGTTRFQKNGNEWNEVVPGTRSFLVVLRVRAQHRNGIFRVRTTLCQNEIWVRSKGNGPKDSKWTVRKKKNRTVQRKETGRSRGMKVDGPKGSKFDTFGPFILILRLIPRDRPLLVE